VVAESAMASEVIALAQQPDDLLEAAVQEHSRLVYRIAYSSMDDPVSKRRFQFDVSAAKIN